MSRRAIREAEPTAAGREMSAFEAAEGALLESGVSASRAVRAAWTRTLVCYAPFLCRLSLRLRFATVA